MALKFVADLKVRLSQILGSREAADELGEDIADATSRSLSSALRSTFRGATTENGKLIQDMMYRGMKKQAHALEDTYKKSLRAQKKITVEIFETEKKLEAAQTVADKKHFKAQKIDLDRRLKREKDQFDKIIKLTKKEAEKREKLATAAMERRERSTSEKWGERGDTFKDAVESGLRLDTVDAKSMAESLSKGISGAMEKGAGSLIASGAGESGGGAFLIAALSGSAAALTAVAGAIAGIVAIAAAAYSQTKEMNKGLLDGASKFDIMGDASRELAPTLGDLRKVAIDTASDFRVSKDEVISAITAFNNAGLTIREFRKFVGEGSHGLSSYAAVARTAIVASQGLGVSVSEVAEFTQKLYRDMGYQLEGVQGAFGLISEEASKAGMSTKDFFAAINAASSGMALYNFRLTDTVGLFGALVGILGEEKAKDEIGLKKTYADANTADRIKTTMLTGGAAGKITKADAEVQGKAFAEKFGNLLGSSGPLKSLITSSGGVDVEKLGKMSGPDYEKLLSETRKVDKTAALQLDSLRTLSKSFQEGLGNVAYSLQGLSKLGEMATLFSSTRAVLGHGLDQLNESSAEEVAAAENMTGLSGEALRTQVREAKSLRQTYLEMRGSAEKGDEILSKTFYEALTEGLLTPMDGLQKAAEVQYTVLEQAALDQLTETRSISQEISNTIAGYLEQISKFLEYLVDITPWPHSDKAGDKAERIKALSDSRQGKVMAMTSVATLDKKIREAQTKLGAATTDDEKKALRAEIAALKAKQQGRKDLVEAHTAITSGLSDQKSKKEVVQALLGTVTPEEYRSRGISGGYSMEAEHAARAKAHPKMNEEQVDEEMRQRRAAGEFNTVFGDDQTEKLSSDQIAQLVAARKETQRAAEDQKTRDETLSKQQNDDFQQVIENLKHMNEIQDREALGKVYGEELVQKAFSGDKGAVKTLSDKMAEGGVDSAEFQLAKNSGIPELVTQINDVVAKQGGQTASLGDTGVVTPVLSKKRDFIYRGDGTVGSITPIDSGDSFYGAKAGGAIDETLRSLAGGGASGGGEKTVNIYVSGDNEARMIATITRVLKETGYSKMRSYSS